MNARLFAALAIAAWTSAATARAHHSVPAQFDMEKSFAVTGTLVKMVWVNPHSSIEVDVKDAEGSPVRWTFSLPARTRIPDAVIDAFKVGMTVQVTGRPARNGEHMGFVRDITLPDGLKIVIGDV
jgi:hypothetical protein